MSDDAYTFGDSSLAAKRLALLAEVFQQTTTEFLKRLGREPRDLAVDLGCGPGFTTALLHDTLAPARLIGVDSSPAFVKEATRRLGSRSRLIHANVLHLPEQVHDADLIFARFLLTHLAEPTAAVEHWLERLSPTGAIAVEEVESITTAEPTFARYLELQRRMLEENDNVLDIGPVLAGAAWNARVVLRSDVVRVTPSPSVAARMFAMNFASWRTRPAVAHLANSAELDEIGRDLETLSGTEGSEASITWELRQIVIAHQSSG